MEAKVDRERWVSAALAALAMHGVAGVRVETLATRLKVTKGSFYWHFADRSELLDAVLEHYQQLATNDVITRVEATSKTPQERLATLLQLIGDSVEVSAPVESAMRAWAVTEARVRRELERIDLQREAYVADLLVACGLSKAVAKKRSHLYYLALIGEFAWVSHRGAPAGSAVWREQLAMLLAR